MLQKEIADMEMARLRDEANKLIDRERKKKPNSSAKRPMTAVSKSSKNHQSVPTLPPFHSNALETNTFNRDNVSK